MIVFGFCLALGFHSSCAAQDEQVGAAHEEIGAVINGVYVPSTVSKQWRDFWSNFQSWGEQQSPAPDDIEGWDKANTMFKELVRQFDTQQVEGLHLTVTKQERGGVPVLDITPRGYQADRRVLLYLHGGAYTYGAADSTLLNAGSMADAAKMRVISVDYTVAPRGKWDVVTGQVAAVYKSLLDEGYSAKSIGIFGDSAGGGLTAGSVLKMRDQGLPLPGALVLWSPWADITATGDTYVTLKDADPLLNETGLQASADAYAPRSEQKHPYVSPVYGDYSKGFPPTLIQGGTKEIFLSHFVRLYQAIDSAGGEAKLDIYEGMPHCFMTLGSETPEAQLALRKSGTFMQDHLAN